MAKIFIKRVSDFNNQEVDLSNINIKRKAYLSKLSLNMQKTSYYSWLLLKKVVKEEYNLNIDEMDLKYNKHNKPYFDEFFFNISHSRGYIAIAISMHNIGVDIQYIKEDNDKLISRLNETNVYKAYKRFSSLEAYYKKLGCGILPSNLNETVNIEHQEIIKDNDDEYILSVSSDDKNIIIIKD